ncbi:gp77 [Rhodococcus phage ReqiPine5]|uniref:Gp77 n=1 Tax=Rhodococcus phage ReqiPine5 TaxID=691963 RepID=D4P852_9CAUD|nr:gp77 [Rhodococcus phage ReqiPine5]ADD81182.1 gp77 [Rhodococcus phage ReqiPine5]
MSNYPRPLIVGGRKITRTGPQSASWVGVEYIVPSWLLDHIEATSRPADPEEIPTVDPDEVCGCRPLFPVEAVAIEDESFVDVARRLSQERVTGEFETTYHLPPSIPTTVPTPDLFEIPPEPTNPYVYIEGKTAYPAVMYAVDTLAVSERHQDSPITDAAQERLDQYKVWVAWRDKYRPEPVKTADYGPQSIEYLGLDYRGEA